jgi:hypothetical protein
MPLTVSMVAVIEFQHTFSDDELEHASLEVVEPTDEAMQALVIRLENALRPGFNPRRVELEAEAEMEEEDATIDLSWNSST